MNTPALFVVNVVESEFQTKLFLCNACAFLPATKLYSLLVILLLYHQAMTEYVDAVEIVLVDHPPINE